MHAIAKTFGANQALKGVDLTIAAGEVRALVGENGSGKSTLIKILAGYHEADPGASIEIGGRPVTSAEEAHAAGLRVVHQDLGLIESMSVLDNLFLASSFPTRLGTIPRREARRLARQALARVNSHVALDAEIAELTPAQRTAVAIARALGVSDDAEPIRVLVLDEPTANLPSEEVRHLATIVKGVSATGAGVLYVTHRLEEVFEVGDSATVLRDGREVVTAPTAALDRSMLIQHMVGDVREPTYSGPTASLDRAGAALAVEHLSSHDLHGISLAVRPGEIVGVAGITGSGRETLGGAIFGAAARDGGSVLVGDIELPPQRPDRALQLGVAFVPADRRRHGGFMELSARENLSINRLRSVWRFPVIRTAQERALSERSFQSLQVRPAGAYDQLLSTFSGGNQQKIVIGRWLSLEPRVLILEEPTQGVDVATKAFIHQQLMDAAARGSAVLVTSSDDEELAALCQRVAVLSGGRIAAWLEGGDLDPVAISTATMDLKTHGAQA
jgi:ribose transport system ATP-binding protein